MRPIAWLMLGTIFACHRLPTATEFIAEEARVQCAANCIGTADYVVAGCMAEDPAIAQSIAAGRTHYDALAASSCLGALQGQSCASLSDPVECLSVFTGALQAGDECSFAVECASANCGGATCPPTCQANSARPGTPCPCAAELSLACKNGVCVPPGGIGASCLGDSDCDSRFKCAAGACSLRVAGDACDGATRCGPGTGLYCDYGACGRPSATCRSGTCKPRLPAGSSCVWNRLDVAGVPAGSGFAIGFGVDTFTDTNQCAEGLTCIGGGFGETTSFLLTGTCGPLSDTGGPCLQASTTPVVVTGCKAGLVCDGGRCKIPPASGPCVQAMCDPRVAYCADGCLPYGLIGSACFGDGECASGHCQGAVDGDEQGVCTSCTPPSPR